MIFAKVVYDISYTIFTHVSIYSRLELEATRTHVYWWWRWKCHGHCVCLPLSGASVAHSLLCQGYGRISRQRVMLQSPVARTQIYAAHGRQQWFHLFPQAYPFYSTNDCPSTLQLMINTHYHCQRSRNSPQAYNIWCLPRNTIISTEDHKRWCLHQFPHHIRCLDVCLLLGNWQSNLYCFNWGSVLGI